MNSGTHSENFTQRCTVGNPAGTRRERGGGPRGYRLPRGRSGQGLVWPGQGVDEVRAQAPARRRHVSPVRSARVRGKAAREDQDGSSQSGNRAQAGEERRAPESEGEDSREAASLAGCLEERA